MNPSHISQCGHRRSLPPRGLATLEMVLALPILLFVMALIVNVGNFACWKVRGLSIARHAVWASRWPRSGDSNPRPTYWPATASMGANGPSDVTALDDPRVNQPVARGPLPFGTTVNDQLLDPARGLREGSAGLTQNFPLLAKMGQRPLEARTRILDDRWQYPQMGMWSNLQRRIPIIYALAKAPANQSNAYVQAFMAIVSAPFQQQLRPLDDDDEFESYGAMFHWGGAPDFYPPLQQFCSLDQSLVKDRVQNLVDRIQGKVTKDAHGRVVSRIPGVAWTMTQAFIGLYQRVIQEYHNEINAVPPPSQAQIAGLNASIAQLQAQISTLNQFLQTLRRQDGG